MLKFSDMPPDAKVRFLEEHRTPMYFIKPDPSTASRFGLGSPAHQDYIKHHAVETWKELTDGLHVDVLDSEIVPVNAKHNHPSGEAGSGKISTCTACLIEKKNADGRPVVRVNVKALRDVQPLELVEHPVTPRQHKKKRWMSETYHNRIQKKWNKKVADLIQFKPRQEVVIISMTRAAFRAIADYNIAPNNRNAHGNA